MWALHTHYKSIRSVKLHTSDSMGMHKCLRAERSCINAETEPRTYCCGGGVAAGDRGEKIWVGRQGGKKVFGSGMAKIGGGGWEVTKFI